MGQLPFEQRLLAVIQLATLFLLCAKLWWSGLYKLYIFFFAFLALEFLQALLLPFLVPFHSRLYPEVYIVSQALIVCSCIFVILELYSIILRDLEGIRSIARRYIKITLALAILLSLLPLGFEKTLKTRVGYLFLFERPVMSSLLLFVLLLAAFLVYYPVPIGRNVIVYLMGYAVYFMVEAATILLINVGYYADRWLSDSFISVAPICQIFWLLGLNRKGEDKSVVIGHQWNPGGEERLLAQLDEINEHLLRSGRKLKQTQ